MAAPRKASKILELTGAYDKNPNRRNDAEPEGNGQFPKDPPEILNETEKEYWHELVAMVPAGVLTGSDVLAIELLTKLVFEFRTNYSEMPSARLSRMSAEMGRLGLTPADRTKLAIEKPKENKFAK